MAVRAGPRAPIATEAQTLRPSLGVCRTTPLRLGSHPVHAGVHEPWSYSSGPPPAGSNADDRVGSSAVDREVDWLGRPDMGLEHFDLGGQHRAAARGGPGRDAAVFGLPEGERVRLGAGLEEYDLERLLVDRPVLAHELVHARVPEQAVSVLVDIHAV